MTLKYFLKIYVNPYLKINDKPHNRQLFNDSKDMLHKDGKITDKQVNSWDYPRTKWFK